MTAQDYLDKTAAAVKSAFATIAVYDELLVHDTAERSADHVARQEALAAWADNPKVSPLVRPASALAPDEGLSFAREVLYGLIFQVAYQGLKLFSTNATAMPSFCVAGYGGAIPFMVGRQVRNVPLGLIIFAARNHFNHLDLGARLYEINLHVFRELSRNHDLGLHHVDPNFDLQNPRLDSFSAKVAELIGWDSYEAYCGDMYKLIE